MKLSSILSDLGPTVAYNLRLVKVLGSVNAVLFLPAFLLDRSGRRPRGMDL